MIHHASHMIPHTSHMIPCASHMIPCASHMIPFTTHMIRCTHLMRYLASECLQATNSPLMMSTFLDVDWRQQKKKKNVLLRNSQHTVMSHPCCSNVMCINILQSNVTIINLHVIIDFCSFGIHMCTYYYSNIKYREHLFGSRVCYMYDLVPKRVEVKSELTALPVMVAISFSFANTADTISLGGVNIIR